MSRVLIMSATQLRLLASCAMIGFEGACDNHEEADGENSNADLEAVELFINHIVELAAAGDVQVTLETHEDCPDTDEGPAMGAYDHFTGEYQR